ncbi:hypothetical protein Q8F55_009114 [Vanrija albida]|uniref:RRM domain-containing protein n=1 Tax=Vanrija albida TaxID=181172 RepID=A0ABR3PSZ1_9TREE
MADPIHTPPSVDDVCRRANDVIARLTGPPKTRTCPTLCHSPPVASGEQQLPSLEVYTPRQLPQAYRPTPCLRPSPATSPRRLGPGATPSSCGRASRLSAGAPRPSPLRGAVDVAPPAQQQPGVPRDADAAAVLLTNLPPHTAAADLRAAFEPLAPILAVHLAPLAARIEFVHPDAAERAVAIYHGTWLAGQRIVVERASARRQSPPATPSLVSTPASCASASLKHAHDDELDFDPKRPRLDPVPAI